MVIHDDQIQNVSAKRENVKKYIAFNIIFVVVVVMCLGEMVTNSFCKRDLSVCFSV